MPIADVSTYRDRTEDWFRHFHNRRKKIIRGMITPELIREHERDPRGNSSAHGRDLSEVLRYIRNSPSVGKIFIYAAKPFHEYRLARMCAPGGTTEIVGSRTYETEDAAAHAVFIARLEELGLWKEEK